MDLIYWAAMEADCHLTHEDLKLEDVWTSFLLTGYLRFNAAQLAPHSLRLRRRRRSILRHMTTRAITPEVSRVACFAYPLVSSCQ